MRGRFARSLWFRSAVIVFVVSGFFAYNTFGGRTHSESSGVNGWPRRLDESCVQPASPSSLCVPYTIGILYLLLALAVVADEFFVPALTLIGEYFKLSEDVTGATLLAMGGSAPELFCNAAGTFARSNVGFGAIVGSAVFNLCFVVGICAVVSSKALQLTWYPLTRDSCFYMVSLVLLAVFFGVTSPGVIELWEALILHFYYWAYVFFMRYSGRVQVYLDNVITTTTKVSPDVFSSGGGSVSPLAISAGVVTSDDVSVQDHIPPSPSASPERSRNATTRLRASLLRTLTQGEGRALENNLVSRLAGSAAEAFDEVDTKKRGKISRAEFAVCLALMRLPDLDDERVSALFNTIDKDGSGDIDRTEFYSWFKYSQDRHLLEVDAVFDLYDTDKSDTLDAEEISFALETIGAVNKSVSPDALRALLVEMRGDGDSSLSQQQQQLTVTRQQFRDWYLASAHFRAKSERLAAARDEGGEGDDEDEGLSIFPGKRAGSSLAWYFVMLPLALTLGLTLPNVSRPPRDSLSWALYAFVACLAYMGVICYFLVDWIEVVSATAGIPSVISGLTFLAAGTSVPDMLGAIIVAKRGQGDMAVSSSVGSNVFDICVGLAVPWILYYAVYGEAVVVTADSLFVSIIILVVAVVCVVGLLKAQSWKHTKRSGWVFITGYLFFVAQQLARTDWSAGGC